jgi:hypothetical protein
MEVDERTFRTMLRALAKGDMEALERSVIAMSRGECWHSEDCAGAMFPRERLLYAWRHALPPYHRNPCRARFVEARTREQRLVGCRVEIWADDELDGDPSLKGTLVTDHGDAWTIRTQVKNSLGREIAVDLRFALDDIPICRITPNHVAIKVWRSTQRESEPDSQQKECHFLGLPEWEWFAWNIDLGLPSSRAQ